MAITRSCNICALQHPPIDRPATTDAKTKMGPWAYLCDEHVKSHAIEDTHLHTKLNEVK